MVPVAPASKMPEPNAELEPFAAGSRRVAITAARGGRLTRNPWMNSRRLGASAICTAEAAATTLDNHRHRRPHRWQPHAGCRAAIRIPAPRLLGSYRPVDRLPGLSCILTAARASLAFVRLMPPFRRTNFLRGRSGFFVALTYRSSAAYFERLFGGNSGQMSFRNSAGFLGQQLPYFAWRISRAFFFSITRNSLSISCTEFEQLIQAGITVFCRRRGSCRTHGISGS